MQWDLGSWVWFAGVGAGIVVLGLVLTYGTVRWRRARRDRIPSSARESATRQVYRREEGRNNAG